MKGLFYTGVVVFLLLGNGIAAFAQPLGTPIVLNNDTPAYADAGLLSLTEDIPAILAWTGGEDREPQLAILPNGSAVAFWVNRNGSHHLNGVDGSGKLLLPVFEEDKDIDVLIGINTGSNTNWTLCKANPQNGNIFAGATFLASTLTGSEAQIPDKVMDAEGRREDNNQGHGFFRLFNSQLEPISAPISISEFSAGHREWDGCWLNDGKFVIGTACQGHSYEADPDYGTGGTNVVTLNIFQSDGTRFNSEFFIDDLTGEQKNVQLGALTDGFVCVYEDDDSRVNGLDRYMGAIFDNDGRKLKDFLATEEIVINGDDDDPANDQLIRIHPVAMAAGGGSRFVTLYETTAPDGIGLPSELMGMPVVLARLWNAEGEKVEPFILVSQHNDFRSVSRSRCAMARNGSFICSWIDTGADIIQFTDSVIARIFNADGTPATEAFVAHPLPEFADTLGGNPAESIPAIRSDKAAVAWATRAAPNGQFRDIALMVYNNPATEVEAWELY